MLRDRVVAALEGAGAASVIVVGPEVAGGPVAAIAAGLGSVREDVVVVLPGDLPFVTAEAVGALRAALGDSRARASTAVAVDVTVAVDEEGRHQVLCAAWRSGALRRALREIGDPHGRPARDLLAAAGTVVRTVPAVGGSTGRPSPWFDCDTPADLDRAHSWAQDGGHGP